MNNPNAIKRMESIRIGDIMIPLADYPKVNPEQTLQEAIHIMKGCQLDINGVKSLPRVLLAIDDQGRLVAVSVSRVCQVNDRSTTDLVIRLSIQVRPSCSMKSALSPERSTYTRQPDMVGPVKVRV